MDINTAGNIGKRKSLIGEIQEDVVMMPFQ